jgi:hypothetical protein
MTWLLGFNVCTHYCWSLCFKVQIFNIQKTSASLWIWFVCDVKEKNVLFSFSTQHSTYLIFKMVSLEFALALVSKRDLTPLMSSLCIQIKYNYLIIFPQLRLLRWIIIIFLSFNFRCAQNDSQTCFTQFASKGMVHSRSSTHTRAHTWNNRHVCTCINMRFYQMYILEQSA